MSLLQWFLSATLLAGLTSAPARAAAGRPNVVVVLADQWRWEAFGFAGNPDVATPRLDRFAAEGVWLTNAVSALPVCSPTRASLLTGQRPLSHGVFLNDVPLRDDAVTWAKCLRSAGYATACIGKWHVDGRGRSAYIPPERRQGFDYWKAQECTHDYTNSSYYADTPERRRWIGYDAIDQTRDACDYIRGRAAARQKFFLWLAWGPPHDPYFTAPKEYRERYAARNLRLRPNVPEAFAGETRRILAGYYAHCTVLDDCMGRLLDALETAGIADNTLVVFSADHGDMLGSHGQWKKQKPYDESIRVPMVFRWPAGLGRSPRRLKAPISSEDVMPTALGLCGVPIPSTVEGLDFSGYLKGGKAPGDGAAVVQCVAPFGEWERRVGGREYRGLRTERYTYVRDLTGPWLLFDTQSDPYQTNNLVARPGHEQLQRRLDEWLRRKLLERGDRFLPGNQHIAEWGWVVNTHGTVTYTP